MTATPASKICARCKRDLPADQFPRDPRRPDRLYAYCKQCKRDDNNDRRARDPEGYKERDRVRSLARYGLTPESFEAMLAAQDGRCAICGTTEPRRNHGRMAIDHDHATGAIRALLCGDCNNGLGLFHDDPERLRAAAEYLISHRESHQPKEL